MKRKAHRAMDLRRANPCLSTAAIARKVGLSKQRVWQILSAAGLPTKAWRQRYACFRCGAVLERRIKRGLCGKCFKESRRLELVCDVCGRHFLREGKVVVMGAKLGYKSFFCSRKCLGRFIGEKYGLKAHPENWRPRKCDYDLVQALRDAEGWGARRISEALGISERTVYKIWRKNRVAHGPGG